MFRTVVMMVLFLCFVSTSIVTAQYNELAKDFYRHNLLERAKEVFIITLHDTKASAETKADALYWLGQISFEEGRYTVAFDDWEKSAKEYPQSQQAKEITERLAQLQDVIAQVSGESISSVVARSYIQHGDFWSKAERRFTIDSSWLPNVELAIEWYDRVIEEFPDSDAAEIAYQRKLYTLLGWEELGQYGDSYGSKKDFKKYMPQILETFTEFEKAIPNSSYLQGFRYQIAQAYWGKKKWSETREWLQKVIDAGEGTKTFYTETAKARLTKVEY